MNRTSIRMYFVFILLAAGMAGVTVRLVSIQIVHQKEYAVKSRTQSQQREVVRARRGRILDKQGRVLAYSMDKNVTLDMAKIGRPAGDAARGGRDRTELRRVYPYGPLAAQVLGFTGTDGDGLDGIEFMYDNRLRGEDGWSIVQRDALVSRGRQNRYRTAQLPARPPIAGCDVHLTLDIEVQRILQDVLRSTMESLRARAAMGMVMEPHTGRIIAMANEPSFDPNFPTSSAAAGRRNRCVSENYEPGSTFKVITAAAVLDRDIVGENDTVSGGGGVFEIYHEKIHDHKPYGRLSFTEAMAYSSNVCFARVASRLDNEYFFRFVSGFGLGDRTGVSLPGEEAGIVRPISRWSGRTRVTMAIGQEISVTLLQMMTVYASVANGGVLVKPVICEKIVTAGGTAVDTASGGPVRRVLDESTCERLTRMLVEVVNRGTGTKAALPGIAVAGKTGTSQKLERDTVVYSDSLHYASFIGFVPADKPALVCGIVVDEPAGREAGGSAAAPAFRQVVSQIISHPGIEYAERILPRKNDSELCAADSLDAHRNRRETHPAVAAGIAGAVDAAAPVSALVAKPVRAAGGMVTVPDCNGSDARDALQLLYRQGLTPVMSGAGLVRTQLPRAGTMVRQAAACTLFCSLDG